MQSGICRARRLLDRVKTGGNAFRRRQNVSEKCKGSAASHAASGAAHAVGRRNQDSRDAARGCAAQQGARAVVAFCAAEGVTYRESVRRCRRGRVVERSVEPARVRISAFLQRAVNPFHGRLFEFSVLPGALAVVAGDRGIRRIGRMTRNVQIFAAALQAAQRNRYHVATSPGCSCHPRSVAARLASSYQ